MKEEINMISRALLLFILDSLESGEVEKVIKILREILKK